MRVSTVPGFDRGKPARPALQLETPDGGLLSQLCETYDACMSGQKTARIDAAPPVDFGTMFGLRDFMHFIKLLGRLALADLNEQVSLLETMQDTQDETEESLDFLYF